MSWWDAFTVLDVETTGLDPSKGDRVIELGAARFERGQLVDKANYVVWQDIQLDPKITRINGLTQADIEASTTPFGAVWEALAPMFDGAWPVAYNAPFDRRFLQNEVRMHRGRWTEGVLRAAHVHSPEMVWIDVLIFVRAIDQLFGRCKLGDACKRRGIEIANAHQAVYDCIATGQLLNALAPQLPAATEDLLAKQAEHARLDAKGYGHYQRRKNSQSTPEGVVFECDACSARKWTEKKSSPPAGWAFYKPDPDGSKTTCSVSCDAQMLWWDSARSQVEGNNDV